MKRYLKRIERAKTLALVPATLSTSAVTMALIYAALVAWLLRSRT